MPKPSNKKSFVVVRGSDSEDDIAIPQARTVRISNTRLNIIQTPRSPQKGVIPPCRVPSPVYEWHPSNDYDCETADYDLAEDEILNETKEVPTVAAKVAAKRYPTSVSTTPYLYSMQTFTCYRMLHCGNGLGRTSPIQDFGRNICRRC